MKYLFKKDLNNRKKFYFLELKKKLYLYSFTRLLSSNRKNSFFFNRRSKVKLYSKTKIVRRCVYTNRSRGSSRVHSISRSLFREHLNFGLIPGYKRAAW